jgi:hypothetical protein
MSMCEDCEGKRATYAGPESRAMRWCGACSKAHPGARYANCKPCEVRPAAGRARTPGLQGLGIAPRAPRVSAGARARYPQDCKTARARFFMPSKTRAANGGALHSESSRFCKECAASRPQ